MLTDKRDISHSWHPFTQMAEYMGNERLHVERAEGCWLFDKAGKAYLDGNASVWTNVHGHNDPELNAALTEQLGKVAHVTLLGLNHPLASSLAEKLSGLTGDRLARCFFSDCGAMAVEVAVKLSLQYRQLTGQPERQRILAMGQAYHGDSFGTMALGDGGRFHGRFAPWFFAVDRFPAPNHAECGGKVFEHDTGESLAKLANHLERFGAETSCLVLEPSVQGAAGMKQQPPGFVAAVSELCHRHGVHLILDEIFVGFRRLGPLLVGERENAQADFLCLAKGLTAGYMPLAATLASEEVYEAFLGSAEDNRSFFHGHTFTGNPLACAVALKSLEKLRRDGCEEAVQARADQLGRGLLDLFSGHPYVRSLRQRGLTAALELGPEPKRGHWSANQRSAFQICLEARKRGLVLRPLGDCVLLVPPQAIRRDELDFLLTTLRAALDAVAPRLPLQTP